MTYVRQLEQTVATTGTLRQESVAQTAQSELLVAFRKWRQNR
jgi:hypothetical protein